jgi:hypothetical protein
VLGARAALKYWQQPARLQPSGEQRRRLVVVNRQLLSPPIHCLGFQAGGRRRDKLHFVPG